MCKTTMTKIKKRMLSHKSNRMQSEKKNSKSLKNNHYIMSQKGSKSQSSKPSSKVQ